MSRIRKPDSAGKFYDNCTPTQGVTEQPAPLQGDRIKTKHMEKKDERTAKQIKPAGFNNISLYDFAVLAPIIHKDKVNHHHTLAHMKCIDDLLELQKSSALLNTWGRGAKRDRAKVNHSSGWNSRGLLDTMEQRLLQLIAEEKMMGINTDEPTGNIQLQIKNL